MAGTLRTWASCWLAAIAPAALAEAAARECASQDCEFEDHSLLSIRRVGTHQTCQPPFECRADVANPQADEAFHGQFEGDIVSLSNYTPADTGDDIEVLWLTVVVGPVNTWAGNKFGKGTKLYNLITDLIGLYHAGIGFRNNRTGLETVAQYYVHDFNLSLISPKVNINQTAWTWDRKGIIDVREGIGIINSYWTARDPVKVATIKGSDYNKLVADVIAQKQKKRPYVMFTPSLLDHEVSIQPHLPNVPAAPGLPPGSETCMDFAAVFLWRLQEIAGSQVFDMSNLVTRDDQYLWMKPGTKAVKLDISGGLGTPDYDFALNFFIAMQTAIEDPSWIGRLEDLFRIAGSDVVFADVNDDYWRLTPNFPVSLAYRKSTVPPVTPVAM